MPKSTAIVLLFILSSRYPIIQQSFMKYTKQGRFCAMLCDGEFFAGKGVGQVLVSPRPGITLDIIVTHTISEVDSAIREGQVKELLDVVMQSKSDFVIMGGDLNASPTAEGDQTYTLVKKVMIDTFTENNNILSWLDPKFATFRNKRNSYAGDNDPVILDYIFFMQKTEKPARIWTSEFKLPFLSTVRGKDKSTISLSDHEAISAKIFLWKE